LLSAGARTGAGVDVSGTPAAGCWAANPGREAKAQNRATAAAAVALEMYLIKLGNWLIGRPGRVRGLALMGIG
jgi:hypothetical protein